MQCMSVSQAHIEHGAMRCALVCASRHAENQAGRRLRQRSFATLDNTPQNAAFRHVRRTCVRIAPPTSVWQWRRPRARQAARSCWQLQRGGVELPPTSTPAAGVVAAAVHKGRPAAGGQRQPSHRPMSSSCSGLLAKYAECLRFSDCMAVRSLTRSCDLAIAQPQQLGTLNRTLIVHAYGPLHAGGEEGRPAVHRSQAA